MNDDSKFLKYCPGCRKTINIRRQPFHVCTDGNVVASAGNPLSLPPCTCGDKRGCELHATGDFINRPRIPGYDPEPVAVTPEDSQEEQGSVGTAEASSTSGSDTVPDAATSTVMSARVPEGYDDHSDGTKRVRGGKRKNAAAQGGTTTGERT